MATEANGFVFISGQVAIDPAGRPTPDNSAEQTRLIMENIGRILSELGLAFADVVKASVFMVDIGDFGSINEVYGSFFPGNPPARSAFQVAALPSPQFKVEIEIVAAR